MTTRLAKSFIGLSLLIVCGLRLVSASDHRADILMLNFTLPEHIDTEVNQEDQRLLAICKVYKSSCFQENLSPKKWDLISVYKSPNSQSEILGEIQAILKVDSFEFGGLHIGLDFLPVGSNRPVEWLADVGDWGYGIRQFVLSQDGEWVQLPAPFPPSAWIKIKNDSFWAEVASIQDDLITLPSLPVSQDSHYLNAGNYRVQSITKDRVRVRPEIPSDMACGEEVQDPPMPASVTIPRRDLFNKSGLPVFKIAYGKGC